MSNNKSFILLRFFEWVNARFFDWYRWNDFFSDKFSEEQGVARIILIPNSIVQILFFLDQYLLCVCWIVLPSNRFIKKTF